MRLARLARDSFGPRLARDRSAASAAGIRQAAALRLGFAYEGTFRKHMIVKGQGRDTAWYAMLDDDWPRVRANIERWLAAGVSHARVHGVNRPGGDILEPDQVLTAIRNAAGQESDNE